MPCAFPEAAGAAWQHAVEIDRRLIQNPAYGLVVWAKKPPLFAAGGFFASCPGQRLGAEIFTNGFVIQPGCAPASVVRSPGRHIGLAGNKALLFLSVYS